MLLARCLYPPKYNDCISVPLKYGIVKQMLVSFWLGVA